MGMGWEWKKKQFIWVCRYKRHEKICSCSRAQHLNHTKRSMLVASITDQYKEHRLKTESTDSFQKAIHTTINNQQDQHHSKTNTQSFINTQYKQPQSIYPIGTSTIQITTYSTNKSPIHKAPDSLMVSHSEIKRSLFPTLPSTGHSARSRRRSRRIHPPTNNSACRTTGRWGSSVKWKFCQSRTF